MTSLKEIEPKPTKFMHPLGILNLDMLPILLHIYISIELSYYNAARKN